MVHLPRVEATLAPLALLTKTVWLPWIKLVKPDARLIRLSEKTNNWTFNLAQDKNTDPMLNLPPGPSGWIIFSSTRGESRSMIRSARRISLF